MDYIWRVIHQSYKSGIRIIGFRAETKKKYPHIRWNQGGMDGSGPGMF